ncbi:hypothetical protein U1839_23105 [Sphingomonas sp. RT2P30]|uniref:hypothetical protein n=1 Tax=Parasphingomonas halimpatiens TaxID=3096162 RepID=UPI002FC88F8D
MNRSRPASSDIGDIRASVVANIETLEAMSFVEGFGVHRLCAGLYARAYRCLLAHFETLPDPAFAYLVMVRFHDLYVHRVLRPALCGRRATNAHWRRYAALAARTTMASPIGDHFRLLSLGARAHVRYDLVDAICLAVVDHRRLFGHDPDLDAVGSPLLGAPTSGAFYQAALDYNAMHRVSQRGWRRVQLTLHAGLAQVSRPLWLAILQSWRRAAWRDAMAVLEPERKVVERYQ